MVEADTAATVNSVKAFPGFMYYPKKRIGGERAGTANDAFIVQLMNKGQPLTAEEKVALLGKINEKLPLGV